jgi:hypothetical protein
MELEETELEETKLEETEGTEATGNNGGTGKRRGLRSYED